MRPSFLAAAGAVALLLRPALGTPPAAPRPVLQIMLEMSRRHAAAEKKLLDGSLDEALSGELDALAGLYGELRGSYSPYYGGTAAAWTEMCDRSRAAAEEAARKAGQKDLAGAREAFYRLAKIREEAHEEFRPGVLKRFLRLFRRRPANG